MRIGEEEDRGEEILGQWLQEQQHLSCWSGLDAAGPELGRNRITSNLLLLWEHVWRSCEGGALCC